MKVLLIPLVSMFFVTTVSAMQVTVQAVAVPVDNVTVGANEIKDRKSSYLVVPPLPLHLITAGPAYDGAPLRECPTPDLIVAVQANDRTTLLQKLSENYEVDVQDCNGKTPLHHAVEQHRLGCLRLLLLAAANPNLADDNGVTPLHLAMSSYAQYSNSSNRLAARLLPHIKSIIKWLLFCGADTMLTTKDGRTSMAFLDGVDEDFFRNVIKEVHGEWRKRTEFDTVFHDRR